LPHPPSDDPTDDPSHPEVAPMDAGALAVGAAASVLALARLNSQPLRLDEARTALVADAVLATGVPRVRSEGPTLFGPSEMAPNGLCVLHTPLQFYVAALGRAVRRTPGLTRLPFALIGVAGIWGGIALGDWLVPGAGVWVGLAFLQVPTLLLLRQARYYPLVFAARVFALWALFLDKWWMAALAGVVLAAAEWSGYLATLAASLVGGLLGAWSLAEATGLLSGLVVLAGYAWLRRGVDAPVPLLRHPVDGFLESFWTYCWKLQCNLVPLLPLAAAAVLLRAPVPGPVLAGLGWIVLAHIGLRSVTPAVFTRYLTPAVAPAGVGAGIVLSGIAQRAPLLAVVLGALLAGTDLLHRLPLLLLPARAIRALGFVRCPGGSHVARQAPEDLDRRVRPLLGAFLRELARPPTLRAGGLAACLPPGSRVLIGQTEAPTLQLAGPGLRVVPWGIDKSRERAWLADHPPDYVVLGDIDRPAAALEDAGWWSPGAYRRRVLAVPDVLMTNGETLERHLFGDEPVPVGVEVLERCTPRP
jgi:hypothetical protein